MDFTVKCPKCGKFREFEYQGKDRLKWTCISPVEDHGKTTQCGSRNIVHISHDEKISATATVRPGPEAHEAKYGKR